MSPNAIRLMMVFLCGGSASLEQTFASMPSLQLTAYLLPPAHSVEALRLRQATFGAVQYPVLVIGSVRLVFSQWLLPRQLLSS